LEDSFSDHRKIYCAIKQDKQPTVKRRSVKNTNWDAFENELNAKIGLWFGRVNTPTEIERKLTKINPAIISFLKHPVH